MYSFLSLLCKQTNIVRISKCKQYQNNQKVIAFSQKIKSFLTSAKACEYRGALGPDILHIEGFYTMKKIFSLNVEKQMNILFSFYND